MKSGAESQRLGRPPLSEADRERFRAEVLRTARRLFVAEGFQAVSMRRIAAESGCSPMKLYSYFEGKRDLLRRIWEDSLGRVLTGLRPVLDAEGSPSSRLRNFGIAYVQYWLDHPDEYRVVFMNEDAVHGDGDEYYVYASETLERLGWIQSVVEEGMADREFVPGDPNQIVQQFMCVCGGLSHMLITIPEFPWEEAEQLIEGTVNVFVRGLLAEPNEIAVE